MPHLCRAPAPSVALCCTDSDRMVFYDHPARVPGTPLGTRAPLFSAAPGCSVTGPWLSPCRLLARHAFFTLPLTLSCVVIPGFSLFRSPYWGFGDRVCVAWTSPRLRVQHRARLSQRLLSEGRTGGGCVSSGSGKPGEKDDSQGWHWAWKGHSLTCDLRQEWVQATRWVAAPTRASVSHRLV